MTNPALHPPTNVQLSASDETRFWAKVDKTETCWIWRGAQRSRYGRFRANGVLYQAHRLAWELLRGPLSPDTVLDHGEMCSNRSCIRPDHLQEVPMPVNTARSNAKRAWSCNHPRIPDNIVVTRGGTEACRTCKADRRRRRRKEVTARRTQV